MEVEEKYNPIHTTQEDPRMLHTYIGCSFAPEFAIELEGAGRVAVIKLAFEDLGGKKGMMMAARLAECYNAMRGIENPELFMRQLKEKE